MIGPVNRYPRSISGKRLKPRQYSGVAILVCGGLISGVKQKGPSMRAQAHWDKAASWRLAVPEGCMPRKNEMIICGIHRHCFNSRTAGAMRRASNRITSSTSLTSTGSSAEDFVVRHRSQVPDQAANRYRSHSPGDAHGAECGKRPVVAKAVRQRHGADRRRLVGTRWPGARWRRDHPQQPDRRPAASPLDGPACEVPGCAYQARPRS